MKRHPQRPDPYEAFLEFARGIATATSDERAEAMTEFLESTAKAWRAAQKLASAWSASDSVLAGDAEPEPPGIIIPARTGGSPPLRKFLAPGDVSVRRATLAAIYYLGPRPAKELAAALEDTGYAVKKGNLGDNIRSALWHARKGGILTKAGAFVNDETRAAFAREEGLAMT